MNNERRFLYSTRSLSYKDINRILYKKFYRPHDFDVKKMNKNYHLVISYNKPNNYDEYISNLNKLSYIITEYDSTELFINIIEGCNYYPDFLFVNGDIIDLPLIIDLKIPY